MLLKTMRLHGDEFAVIGCGSQALLMRRYLYGRYRIDTKNVLGFSSDQFPVSKKYYIICATPYEDVFDKLIIEGVDKTKIIKWQSLLSVLKQDETQWLLRNRGMMPKDELTCLYSTDEHKLYSQNVLQPLKNMLHYLLLSSFSEHQDINVDMIEHLSIMYMKLRADVYQKTQFKVKKILYPSTGRCGGTSITSALLNHPYNLSVSHEGYSSEIYTLLVMKEKFKLSSVVMATITSIILEDSDALGGNPICFLCPYLELLPWFECYIIKVERTEQQLLDSIINRNFHYSEFDFVPNRLTAENIGQESLEKWQARTIEQKVTWYIDSVNTAIHACKKKVHSYVVVTFPELNIAFDQLFEQMQWPKLIEPIPHINTIPTDKVYSHQKRIQMFEELNEK